MNYNPQFDNQNQYAQPVEKNAAYYRAKAREHLKGFWWKAILVTLIASLLGGIAAGGFSYNFNFDLGDSGMDDPTIEEEGDDLTLNAEQSAAMEEALANGDYAAIKDIFNQADPMFNLVFTIMGVIVFVIFAAVLAYVYFVGSPVKVGYQRFFLALIDGNNEEIGVGTLFRHFKRGYLKTVGLSILHDLIMSATMLPFYILTGIGTSKFIQGVFASAFMTNPSENVMNTLVSTLFSMIGLMLLGLLISACINIPVSYMYSMAHLIMADYPNMSPIEALRASRQMMKGNKFRLFCLDFSFIGWALLGSCVVLGVYAVTPYQYAARAAFYNDISGRDSHKDVEFPSINPSDYVIE